MRNYRGLTENDKWVYGNYCNLAGLHFISEYPVGAGRNVDGKLISGWIRVLGKTVGQQVGKKDRNGKEAYAGDKLKDSSGDIGVIYWKDSIAGFYCKWGDGSDLPLNTFVAVNKCEIIGDIHEKPELLNKETT